MINSIHGHEVLNLLLAQSAPVTKSQLKQLMHDKFGENAQYHTCSASEMNADDLIEFLDKKGKFINADNGISTAKDNICQH